MSEKKYLIVVGGPTASGKTAMAIKLAQHFDTEIISSDSRQFYREMSIGTAKPDAAELAAVRHHFIDSLSITTAYSVGDFEKDALNLLDSLYSTRNYVVMVGGSGLFINALCEGLDQFPDISEAIKLQVDDAYKTQGLTWLQTRLAQLDPVMYERIDKQNPARMRRAVEVCLETGHPYSSYLDRAKPERPFTPIYVQLDLPRATLYQRIDDRVDAMMAAGLLDEVHALLPFRHLTALNTVGYTELFDYFDGNTSLEEAVSRIKQHSRNYAKRQLTWFRKYGNWTIFAPDDTAEIIEFCTHQN